MTSHGSPNPQKTHKLVWTLPVCHLQRKYVPQTDSFTPSFIEDTYITLWQPLTTDQQNRQPWLIQKRMVETGGNTMPALNILAEKNTIKALQILDLPCAQLVDPPPPGLQKSPEQGALEVWTTYGGMSLEDVFKQTLNKDEYTAAFVAALKVIDRFAEANTLMLDCKARNFVIEMSEVTFGALNFQQCVAIDHAHTVTAQGAAQRRWPHIGLQDGDAPEVVELLKRDKAQSMKQIAGCPYGSYAELRKSFLRGSITQQEYAGWMSKLTSPNFGGALERNELDAGRAMQSIFANGWLTHLVPGAQKRLAANAHMWLASHAKIIQKMASPKPADRYDRLQDVITELTRGITIPEHSNTSLRIDLKGRRPSVRGGSDPDTNPEDMDEVPAQVEETRTPVTPVTPVTPPNPSVPGNSDPGRFFPEHDGSSSAGNSEIKVKDVAATHPLPAWIMQQWQRHRLPPVPAWARRTAMVATLVLVVGLLLSQAIVRDPTPQTLAKAHELVQFEQLQRMLDKQITLSGRKPVYDKLTTLARQSKDQEIKEGIQRVLTSRYEDLVAQLRLNTEGKLVTQIQVNSPQYAAIFREIQELADQGVVEANIWKNIQN